MQTTNQHHQAGRGKQKRETNSDGLEAEAQKTGDTWMQLEKNGPGQISGDLPLVARTLGWAVLVVVLY